MSAHGRRLGHPAGERRGEVRLIGGAWKRSKLPVPDLPGLRPTPDRLRETLFNWLGQDLTGRRVLDAFAGSGALGFEAGSRGAAEVVLLERDPAAAAGLERSRQRLHGEAMSVVCTEALRWMARAAAARFDLVLLDPPFDSDLAAPALQAAARLLAGGGLVYLETGAAWDDAALGAAGYVAWRRGRAGAVHAALLRRIDGAGAAPPGRTDGADAAPPRRVDDPDAALPRRVGPPG